MNVTRRRLRRSRSTCTDRSLAHVERRAALGVERAQPDPVAADPAQRDVLLDDFGDRQGRSKLFEILFDDRHGREITGGVSRLDGGRIVLRMQQRRHDRHCEHKDDDAERDLLWDVVPTG
jgi:hypothetical protein